MNKNQISFPISAKDIEPFIQEKHQSYILDDSIKQDIIEDASSDIYLVCKEHDNLQFKSKWRYLRSNANKNTGHCIVCLAEQGLTRIKIKYLVDLDMQKHPTHPAKIVDKRYSKYSRIKTDELVLVECLKCGDRHRVSINNFFSEGVHQCKNCTKLFREKYGHPNKKITVDGVNKKLKVFGFKLVDKKINIKNRLTLQCPKGHLFKHHYEPIKKKFK
jgi:hypothetical protein